ncbi:PLC-like phosphodiesterase [Auriculariales sp. MPI-PUGE-AT-0066]|nr:PLC-like phosphodiesterase [Auriculariales sp. MPI-PUGE-AT-0066]
MLRVAKLIRSVLPVSPEGSSRCSFLSSGLRSPSFTMRFGTILFAIATATIAYAAPHLQSKPSALDVIAAPSDLNVTAEIEKRTGQGGYIALVNGGSYTWNLGGTSKYQMNAWSWPSTIAPYSVSRVYIEFDTTIGRTKSDDAGEATYTLAGTSFAFQIQARSKSGFNLQVVLTGMSTKNNAQGSTISLGWKHDGVVNWVLSGADNRFTSSRPPANWMEANMGDIGGLTIRQLSVPGSHDAGMSRITGGTAFGRDCNSLTQTANIAGQLAAGSRYFDVRPVITGGLFSTGHYTGDASVLDTFQGANGQPISEIISQVNAFTASNKELVVINLSHSLNTDVGTSNYRSFNQDEWNRVLTQLMGLNNLLVASSLPSGFNATSGDLSALKLNQLIGGRAAVVLVVENGADLSSWFGKGVFSYGQYGGVYNSYSDSNNKDTVRNDQIDKLVNQHGTLHLVSWTSTQDSTQAVLCSKSILDLASDVNPLLYTDLINAVSPTRNIVPNILYVDAMSNADIVGVAMAYNWWQAHH